MCHCDGVPYFCAVYRTVVKKRACRIDKTRMCTGHNTRIADYFPLKRPPYVTKIRGRQRRCMFWKKFCNTTICASLCSHRVSGPFSVFVRRPSTKRRLTIDRTTFGENLPRKRFRTRFHPVSRKNRLHTRVDLGRSDRFDLTVFDRKPNGGTCLKCSPRYVWNTISIGTV